MKKSNIRDSGFVVLRTPMLPVNAYLDRGSFSPEILSCRQFSEALFLASPDLYASLEYWRDKPNDERGRKIGQAVFRYFARMCTRPTPFGLFAGCSVAETGAETRLEIEDTKDVKRITRLDMDYLASLTAQINQDPERRSEIPFRPNSSLYETGGRWHYAEARMGTHGRRYHLVAVQKNDYIEYVLDAAQNGLSPNDLAQCLVDHDADIDPTEAEEFISELIACQILVSDLSLPVTGTGALADIRNVTGKSAPLALLNNSLAALEAKLNSFDQATGAVDPHRYLEFAKELEQFAVPVEANRMIQVDAFRPSPNLTLGEQPLAEIRRAVGLLHAIAPVPSQSSLMRFRGDFEKRYGDGEIPLTEALDEETGIGFMKSTAPLANASPLLAGLPLSPATPSAPQTWDPWHRFLLQQLSVALSEGRQEIELSEESILSHAAKNPLPLPRSFAVMASLAASSPADLASGDFKVHVGLVAGPSGARILGRFSHLDDSLREKVAAHLREEEQEYPDAIYAEIVHLPEGRLGNILSRPVLRKYEIPFLGKSGVADRYQIPVTDLMVSVRNGRVVLRSKRLKQEVIPRLTTAHGYLGRNLGMYKFLASLQSQGVAANCGWSWGPLDMAPRLPRVTCGKVVLAKARWCLGRDDIVALAQCVKSGELTERHHWRDSRQLPGIVELVEGDNNLTIDLADEFGVSVLSSAIRLRHSAVLQEAFPGSDELVVQGSKGRYAHELIIPMINTSAISHSLGKAQNEAVETQQVAARFAPGSEWLYAKLYCGSATADHLLDELVAPLVNRLQTSGLISQWFFIRFRDPDWHIRLRFKSRSPEDAMAVLPQLHDATATWLQDRRLHRVQYETYDREVERYGGANGIIAAEKMFHIDSEAVLEMLKIESGDEGITQRWRWALLGVDMLFEDLGLSPAQKLDLLTGLRESFFQEFGGHKNLHRELGLAFRRHRKRLEDIIGGEFPGGGPHAEARRILLARRQRWQQLARELVRQHEQGLLTSPIGLLAAALAHMHVNRMMRSEARAHELVIYDHLHRMSLSRAARVGGRMSGRAVKAS